ncbi:hypothetical protein P7F88_25570 [Vibrio hannami]|uniref:hypothetical protein n=1 Tax=Vibrio hannami TaxID=2717094 RepID=UPI0024106862|nr:hypothetical protein [Vibrio hannami]MDG3089236.1 hypothetical protein [Vibrio hannami]
MTESDIQRGDKANLAPSRAEQVQSLIDGVKQDQTHWTYAFDRMQFWRKFSRWLPMAQPRQENDVGP